MAFFGLFKESSIEEEVLAEVSEVKELDWETKVKLSVSNFNSSDKQATFYGMEYPIFTIGADGEKTQGELGAPVDYDPMFYSMAARGWQMYMESDIAGTIINTFLDGVLGAGLKSQVQPIKELLGSDYNEDEYKKIELRNRAYANDENSSHSKMMDLHEIVREAYRCAMVGGDCLQTYRYDNGPTIELTDGRYIVDPDYDQMAKAKESGNKIIHGVEINKRGEHIAYHVLQSDGSTKRHTRFTKSGRLQCKMLYGDRYRIDDVRGMPLYIRSIEKMKKIDRYIEAMVGSAEERAKFSVFFEHNHFSTGEDPMMKAILDAELSGEGAETVGLNYSNGILEAGKKYQQTTGKQSVNMPVGATAKALDSTIELRLREFADGTFLYICASLGMPIEIALKKFEQSFSASRMASQVWKMTIKIRRRYIEKSCYQPFYNLQLDWDVLNGRIALPGYKQAIEGKDIVKLQAYRNARFIGPGVPQADPVKEVKAIVLMLQNNLMSHEEAVELLADGDFDSTLAKLGLEYSAIINTIPKDYQRPPNAEKDTAELPQEEKVK